MMTEGVGSRTEWRYRPIATKSHPRATASLPKWIATGSSLLTRSNQLLLVQEHHRPRQSRLAAACGPVRSCEHRHEGAGRWVDRNSHERQAGPHYSEKPPRVYAINAAGVVLLAWSMRLVGVLGSGI
jgi:hypothetical protein